MRSKAAVIDDALRHADAVLAKAQDAARAVATRFARLPALPIRVPEQVIAAKMTLELPAFSKPPPLSAVSIVVPETPPPVRIEPARIIGVIEPRRRDLPQRSRVEVASMTTPKRIPRPAPIEIANLRIRAPRLAKASIVPIIAVPVWPARPSVPVLPALPALASLRSVKADNRVEPPRVMALPVIPRLPALAPLRLPIFANLTSVDRVIIRTDDARKRDDERRKREDEMVRRAAQEARSAADQRAALDREILAANATSAEKPRGSAWRAARDQRQRAMAEWDDNDRLEGAGMTRPGRALPRPNRDRDAERPASTPRHPGPNGPGIGD